jgi:hypothetical protein
VTVVQQTTAEVPPDKARSTGDENVHSFQTGLWR